MSSDSKIKEAEADRIRRKVDKMYENYGIFIEPGTEGDLAPVYRHYYLNKEQLDIDYEKSKKHAADTDED